jgi:hypothetical protein
MSIERAAFTYWNACQNLLNPTATEDEFMNGATTLADMALHSKYRAIAKHANRTIAVADDRGLIDLAFAMEA